METQTLAERAFEKIKHDILLGELKPGSRLNIEALKRKYSIGLTPLREALNRLISLGFVEFISLKGFKVTQLTQQILEDIYSVRQLIETKALALAIKHGDDVWEANSVASYHQLSKLEQDKNFIAKPNIEVWMKRYHDFHFMILSGCQSNWLLMLDKQLFEQSERYRYLRMSNTKDSVQFFNKKARIHKQLIASIIARDEKKAIQIFSAQLNETVTDLLKMTLLNDYLL